MRKLEKIGLQGLSNCQFSPVALQLADDLSFDEWGEIGRKLSVVQQAVEWWVGDWLRFGEQAYGKKYNEALKLTGYKLGTLRNIASVASRFDQSRRHDALPFSFYLDVGGLEPDLQDELLAKAVNESLKRKQLRQLVKQHKPERCAKENALSDARIETARIEWDTLKARLSAFVVLFAPAKLEVSDFIETIDELLESSQQSPMEFILDLLDRGPKRLTELMDTTGYTSETVSSLLAQLERQGRVESRQQGGETDVARGARPEIWVKK